MTTWRSGAAIALLRGVAACANGAAGHDETGWVTPPT